MRSSTILFSTSLHICPKLLVKSKAYVISFEENMSSRIVQSLNFFKNLCDIYRFWCVLKPRNGTTNIIYLTGMIKSNIVWFYLRRRLLWVTTVLYRLRYGCIVMTKRQVKEQQFCSESHPFFHWHLLSHVYSVTLAIT